MPVFDQRGQKVTYQYNAAGNINFGAVQNRLELLDQLAALQAELSRAKDVGAIDAETIVDANYRLEKARLEAMSPNPDKNKLIERLKEAKAVLEGIGAASGMLAAIAKAVQVVQSLF